MSAGTDSPLSIPDSTPPPPQPDSLLSPAPLLSAGLAVEEGVVGREEKPSLLLKFPSKPLGGAVIPR